MKLKKILAYIVLFPFIAILLPSLLLIVTLAWAYGMVLSDVGETWNYWWDCIISGMKP